MSSLCVLAGRRVQVIAGALQHAAAAVRAATKTPRKNKGLLQRGRAWTRGPAGEGAAEYKTVGCVSPGSFQPDRAPTSLRAAPRRHEGPRRARRLPARLRRRESASAVSQRGSCGFFSSNLPFMPFSTCGSRRTMPSARRPRKSNSSASKRREPQTVRESPGKSRVRGKQGFYSRILLSAVFCLNADSFAYLQRTSVN